MGIGENGAGTADEISSGIFELVDRRAVPGVLAVVSDADRIVYSAAAGAAQRRSGIAVSRDTVYRIASMTKLVTSMAILQLVDDGAVALDAPLARYLPDYRQPEVLVSFDARTREFTTRPAEHEITVRQLLTHTSGYGYWFLDPRLFSLTEGTPDLLNAPFLVDEPGASFNYSTSTDVVAQLIEPVSGKPLEKFFAERIFGPLGMRSTGFEPPDDSARLASIFTRTSEGFTEQELETRGQAPRGGGGLYSTADDYCRLLRVILNRGEVRGTRVLSEASCDALTRNQIGDLRVPVQTSAFTDRTNDFIFMNGTQRFGLGLALESCDQPTGRPSGSGSWAGIYNTYFWVDFRNGFAAAIFMQVQPFSDPACVEAYRRFETALYDCLNDLE